MAVLTPIVWKFSRIATSDRFNAYCKFQGTLDKFGKPVFVCDMNDIKRFIGSKNYRNWVHNMDQEVIVERQTNP
jgi:hypothetical protein